MTSVTTDPRHVILEPVVSEKAYNLIQFDKYTFKVHPTAHKTQVRQTTGFRPGYKKAIIQLRAGDSIELFEGAR
jgi:large subunit ribosomal protein L23